MVRSGPEGWLLVPAKRQASKLQRSIGRMQSSREQPKYQRLIGNAQRAATRAASQGASRGTITAAEKRAISRAAKAVRLTTTPAEAAGVKKNLRKKARRS